MDSQVVIPGSEQAGISETTRFGARVQQQPIDPSKQKTVTVYMRRMNPEALTALSVLASENHLLLRTDTAGGSVQLMGRFGDLWQAFGEKKSGVVYHSVRENMEYDSRKGSLSIPANLALACAEPGQPLAEGDIAVLGLDDRPIASPRYSGRSLARDVDLSAAANSPKPLYAHQVARAYGLPANVGDGDGVIMGIISLGGGTKPKNTEEFCKAIGCEVPNILSYPIGSGGNRPGSDADIERSLDLCNAISVMAYAFGPKHKGKIVIVDAGNTDQDFANGIAELIRLGAWNVGDSWGSAEMQWAAQARAAMQTIVRGSKCRIFPASGDDGDLDGQQTFAVDFLASLPETYAVGGTRLILDAQGNRFSEVVWGGQPGNGAGGGGLSQIYPRPDYQALYPLTRNGSFWHGVPDFSGNADPATAYLIYHDGLISVGGTSGSAPLYATCFCVLDYLGIHLDHQTLYAHPEWFFDVTVGNNSPRAVDPRFPAGKGYDVASGLGVLDFAKVIAANKVTPLPPPVVVSPAPTLTTKQSIGLAVLQGVGSLSDFDAHTKPQPNDVVSFSPKGTT